MILFGKNVQRMYVCGNIIEIGLASVVLEFNNGIEEIRKIYENPGMLSAKFITAACEKRTNIGLAQ